MKELVLLVHFVNQFLLFIWKTGPDFTAWTGQYGLGVPTTRSVGCTVNLPDYDAAVQALFPAEPALRVEVRKMEFAEGNAGQILSLGHHQIGLLKVLHHWFTMNSDFFGWLWMFRGRAMRQNHSNFCNSGVTHPVGEVVECVPIARIQLDHLDYVEGSGDDGRSRVYCVRETTTIIVREDWLM